MFCTVNTENMRPVRVAAGISARVALDDLRSRFVVEGGSLENDEGIMVSGDTTLVEGAVYTFTDFRGR